MTRTAEEIERGLRHLRKADPVLRNVIRRAGPFRMKLGHDRFHALVVSILSQQISGSAARAIRSKLEAFCQPQGICAERIVEARFEDLRKVGLSKQKASYIVDLAQRVRAGELELNRIGRLSDASVIESLVTVKGIGVWTAQMFLIFSLGRLDVFPHTDLGIRTAIQRLYDLDDLPDRDACHRIAQPWRPYASIASWYCWRSLEG